MTDADPTDIYFRAAAGAYADRSKSRFGRRRPVIVTGCLVCVLSLLIFGYTREVASIVTTWGGSAVSNIRPMAEDKADRVTAFNVNNLARRPRGVCAGLCDQCSASDRQGSSGRHPACITAGRSQCLGCPRVSLLSSVFCRIRVLTLLKIRGRRDFGLLDR